MRQCDGKGHRCCLDLACPFNSLPCGLVAGKVVGSSRGETAEKQIVEGVEGCERCQIVSSRRRLGFGGRGWLDRVRRCQILSNVFLGDGLPGNGRLDGNFDVFDGKVPAGLGELWTVENGEGCFQGHAVGGFGIIEYSLDACESLSAECEQLVAESIDVLLGASRGSAVEVGILAPVVDGLTADASDAGDFRNGEA
jgi:hypothetical protein